MRITLLLIATIILFGIMGGLLPTLSVAGVVPNLVLLFVLCLAIEPNNNFLLVAFVGGLLADMGTGAGLGTFTLGYMALGMLLHYIMNQFFFLQSGWKYLPIAVIGATVLLSVWSWAFTLLLVRFHLLPISVFAFPFSKHLIVQVVYSLIALYPIYNLTHALLHWLKRFEQKQRFG